MLCRRLNDVFEFRANTHHHLPSSGDFVQNLSSEYDGYMLHVYFQLGSSQITMIFLFGKHNNDAHVIDRLWPLFTFFCIITKRSSEIENTAEEIDLFTQCEKIFQIMI